MVTQREKEKWKGPFPLVPSLPRTIGVGAVLVFLTVGCASTKEYGQFAKAGTVYAAAVDHLLVTAGHIGVDATSERLLQDDVLKNQDLDGYQNFSQLDQDRLETIGHLRAHIRLLAKYFRLLNKLATSDHPAEVEKAAGDVADALNSLGNQLRDSELIPNKEAFTLTSQVLVGKAVQGALREELNRRKDVLQKEIKTQEELLKALTETIQHDLTVIHQIREQRLVIQPLVDPTPISNPDEWAIHRRAILTSQATVGELAKASDAARELREAFEDLTGGTLDRERVSLLLEDFEGLLAVAEAIKNSQENGYDE
jgi:hypothetical protein